MKKLFSMLVATVMLGCVLLAGNASAITFEPGGNKFIIDGFSYQFATESKLWGIFDVTAVRTWDGETNAPGSVYWQKGDESEFLTIRFGGLDNVVATTAVGTAGYFDNGWAELYSNNFDPFDTDFLSGPGLDYNKGDFANAMAVGNLLLDLEFAEGGILAREVLENALFGDPILADAENTFKVTKSSTSLNFTFGYLNVIGGSLSTIFESDYFLDEFDLFIEGSNQLAPTTPGWNFAASSYSAYANVVPEPGTALLLGIGLLGLAAISRKRNA